MVEKLELRESCHQGPFLTTIIVKTLFYIKTSDKLTLLSSELNRRKRKSQSTSSAFSFRRKQTGEQIKAGLRK